MPSPLHAFLTVASCAASMLLAGGAAFGQGAATADAVAIAPDEAADHAGKECVVTMRVNSSRQMADAGRCYLNSEEDFRDEKNFTVVIFKRGLEEFATAGIDDPARHFRGKTIRVAGTVEIYKDKPQIKVEHPDQVEVVPDEAAAGAGDDGPGRRE